MLEVSSHCDAYRAQLANWGWLPGEPLNWLECSVPDFSDMKYRTCCFAYTCGNQQQCDCSWCFCGSQKVLKSLLLAFAVFHECESIIRNVVSTEIVTFDDYKNNCKSSWLGKHGASFLWIWFSPCIILDYFEFFSSIILSKAFAVKTAPLAVQSTTQYISVIVLTLRSPSCLSPAQKQSCVCWIYAKRRTLLQFWQSYEGLRLFLLHC